MTAQQETRQLGFEGLQGVIITDCHDPNARARQQVRFISLFGVQPTFIELGADNPDLEAAGHLVDVLDATTTPYGQVPSVILVNVAPRGDDVRKNWENGTPFCHFKVDGATVLSTYEGRALSLVHKLGLVSTVHLLDIPEVTNSLVNDGVLTTGQAEAINNSQFRSLEFLPLAARELVTGSALPASKRALKDHPEVEKLAWFVDSFGNIKTTLLDDGGFEEGRVLPLSNGDKITCHRRLADVPTGEFGLTIGSSGYGDKRWLEIVRQRGRAADDLGVKVGAQVLAVA